MEFFYRSDLACEAFRGDTERPAEVKYESFTDGFGNKVERMYIPKSLEDKLYKSEGNYITVNCDRLHEIDLDEREALSILIADELRLLLEGALQRKIDTKLSVLVAGLGNSSMTPDSIGPKTVEKLIVTSHLKKLDKKLYEKLGCCALSAIAPGVLGQTGIESSELIIAAKECARAEAVIVIDALAAGSFERLGATLQLCDTGIRPGSGIGNRRKEISQKTLGVPVIVIGVPTVMDSSTLIYDVVSQNGKNKLPLSVEKILENGRSFFVSPKDCDEIARVSCDILSDALNSLFGIKR